MKTEKIDTLGRIALPMDVVQQLSLTDGQNLLITLDESHFRIVLQPTDESAEPFSTDQELKERQAAMLQLPTH